MRSNPCIIGAKDILSQLIQEETFMRSEKKETALPVPRTLKEYTLITAAVLIMDIGIYVFKFPNNFSFGGVSGMAVVFSKFSSFSASQINLIINLLLLVVGFAFLGKNFGLKTAYVTVLSSILLNIFEKIFPMTHPLTDEIMLELCFAILLPAIAAAMLFFENASGGGTDIIAMIIRKYSTMNISTALLFTDLIVVIVSFLIFDVRTGLCSILGLFAKTLLIDKSIERMKLNKFFTIVSNNPDPICNFITNDLNHSATTYHAEGAYSHKDRTVILTVVDVRQAILLQRFISRTDPTAFTAITKSSEIVGKAIYALHITYAKMLRSPIREIEAFLCSIFYDLSLHVECSHARIYGCCAQLLLDAEKLIVFCDTLASGLGAPVLIWQVFSATARSAIVVSSVSPERWEEIAV